MPYINKLLRENLATDGEPAQTCGELNYLITKQILDYVRICLVIK